MKGFKQSIFNDDYLAKKFELLTKNGRLPNRVTQLRVAA